MSDLLDLIVDSESSGGRLVTSLVVAAAALLAAAVGGRLVARRIDDPLTRYHVRKAVRAGVVIVALLALAVVWRPFAGRIGVVVGLAAAGVAFAMQEVIGALAGWFNILSGRIFRAGDRIEMGGVRGDVIDITPLRTKILEIGAPTGDASPVKGRQLTGRIVTVSNKATFTQPVFNYSATFDYVWEELALPIPHEADWDRAEEIMREEAERASSSAGARRAMEQMAARYPLPRAEIEPRVFVRATDDWMELSARFVVPVRAARVVKDQMTRRITERLADAGIPLASSTIDARVRMIPADDPPRGSPGG